MLCYILSHRTIKFQKDTGIYILFPIDTGRHFKKSMTGFSASFFLRFAFSFTFYP